MANIEILIDPDAEEPFATAHIDETDLRSAVSVAAKAGHCDEITIGIRITMDAAIHQINRQFLQHDYPTDVISFPYDLAPPRVEGELVVSIETATVEAQAADWSTREELLLYVVHGTLHLVGYDDTASDVRAEMRRAERAALALLGIESRSGLEPIEDRVQ